MPRKGDHSAAGKTIVVTGASSGIGRAAAVELARRGADVVLVCRDPDRASDAAAEARAAAAGGSVSTELADMGELDQVRDLAARLLQRLDRIDVLVNNAATLQSRRHVTSAGHELTLAVNHLGPFTLTNLLRGRLVASAPARIVNVTSVGHKNAHLDLDDLNHEHGDYRGFTAYANTKLAIVLTTLELARQLHDTGVTANCVHPGTVRTGIFRHGHPFFRGFMRWAGWLVRDQHSGAGPIVHLATHPDLTHTTGRYYNRYKPAKPSTTATDPHLARQLWHHTTQLTGLHTQPTP